MTRSLPTATRRGVLCSVPGAAAVLAAGGPFLIGAAHASALPPLAVWKDTGCACCEGWIAHMRRAGFSTMVRDSDDMTTVKQARGVPEALWSCHTAVIDGYVIEGWHGARRDAVARRTTGGQRPGRAGNAGVGTRHGPTG